MTGARIRLGFILCYPVNYIAGEREEDDWMVDGRRVGVTSKKGVEIDRLV